MADAKHTPGPWKVEDPLGPGILSIVAGGPEVYNWRHVAQLGVDDVEDDPLNLSEAEQKANANLIAAAPDLLAAVHALLGEKLSRPADAPNYTPAERIAIDAVLKAQGLPSPMRPKKGARS